MANGHGGQRTPSNPAPVSGPGALSRRTDGGATAPPAITGGGEYGATRDLQAIQSGAAMGGGGATPASANLIPFGAPSQSPGEPVTAGAALGPGMGPEAAGIQDDETASLEQLRPMVKSLELIANLPGSNQQTRAFVRALKARIAERG